MSKNRYGHEAQVMLSLQKAEASYGAGVTVSGANCRLLKGYVHTVSPEDVLSSDLEEHTGTEAPTAQEVMEWRTKLSLEFPQARPDVIAGLAYLCANSITSSQEGEFTSYKHFIKRCATTAALKTIAAWINPGNRQDGYVGVAGSSFEISGEEAGPIKFMAELSTSGQLSETAETMQAVLAEVLLFMKHTKVYVKTSPAPATDWIATANVSQTTSNIDQAQGLTALGATVKSFSFKENNNLDEQAGAGGSGYLQGVDYGRRTVELTMSVRYEDETWRDRFTAQTPMSLEFNCNSGTLVDAAGANKYGFILRISKAILATRPVPQGGPGDAYTQELTFTLLDDGTNPVWDLHVYNAENEYLG